MLMGLPCRERSDAKEERNDRTHPEAPPLPNINESRRNQSESFKSTQRIDVRSNRSGQTLKDEEVCIRSVIRRLSPRLLDVRERVGSVLEEVARLQHLVSGLLVLSRLDAGETQSQWMDVDLAELTLSTA
jgi:signal transduction histidine kinase